METGLLGKRVLNEVVRVAPSARVNAVCPGWTPSPTGHVTGQVVVVAGGMEGRVPWTS